jgi:ankyrin repeat protein
MGLFGRGNKQEGMIQQFIDASKNGDNNKIIKLIQKGIDVNAKSNSGRTPLNEAALHGHTETARLLIDNGADVMAKDNLGLTTLHHSACWDNTDTARLLIDNGADVMAKDNFGNTTLHVAALLGHTETAKLLIDNGADVKAKDNDGITPLNRAEEKGRTETAKLLIDNGADVKSEGRKGLIEQVRNRTESLQKKPNLEKMEKENDIEGLTAVMLRILESGDDYGEVFMSLRNIGLPALPYLDAIKGTVDSEQRYYVLSKLTADIKMANFGK